MKLLILLLLTSTTLMAEIPNGTYELEKIQCTTGRTLKLGSTLMSYKVFLQVSEQQMLMRAKVKTKSYANFLLKCEQINRGKFSYIGDNQFEGYLALDKAKCNAKLWTRIIKKRAFGVAEQGLSEYEFKNNKLKITNLESKNLYSCKKESGIPVYYYKKIK